MTRFGGSSNAATCSLNTTLWVIHFALVSKHENVKIQGEPGSWDDHVLGTKCGYIAILALCKYIV
jgi:hypothetical protein